MKTLNTITKFTDAQERPKLNTVLSFELYRRYYDSATRSCLWEAVVGIGLNDYYIENSISDITWQLDTQELNEFKLGNVTFDVNNEDGIFDTANENSIWNNYLPYLSIVKIKIGVLDIDGTEQNTYVFNGVIAKDGITISNNYKQTAQIKVLGLEELLNSKNAEDVADKTDSIIVTTCDLSSATTIGKTGETWGGSTYQYMGVRILTGKGAGQFRTILDNDDDELTVNAWDIEPDDSPDIEIFGEYEISGAGDTIFTTDENGVGIIKRVYVMDDLALASDGATPLDYAISDLNLKTTPATITFGAGLNANDIVLMEYIYWYQDKTIKELVDLLLTGAGITNSYVEDALFDNVIPNEVTHDTKAEWDAYVTQSNIATEFDDIEGIPDNAIAQNLKVSGVIEEDITSIVGKPVWNLVNGGYIQTFTHNTSFYITKIILSVYIGNNPTGQLRVRVRNSLYGSLIYQDTINASDLPVTPSVVRTVFVISNPFRINKNQSYAIVLEWINDSGTPPTSSIFIPYNNSTYANGQGYTMNTYPYTSRPTWDMNFTVEGRVYDTSGYAFSNTIDGTASLTNWGKIISSIVEAGGGTVKVYTRTQDADVGFPVVWNIAEWDEIDSITHSITSETKRYLKIAIVYDTTDIGYTAYLSSLTLSYYTDQFEISLANFTSLSIWDAIKELARMPNYEVGFKVEGDGVNFFPQFFFRTKDTVSTEILKISDVTHILQITNYNSGNDFLFNKVVVSYGNYNHIVDGITDPESDRPNSSDKYNISVYSLSGGNLLGDEGVNIARGIALRYYDQYKTAKIRCNILCDLLLQLDLSDIIEVTVKYPTVSHVSGRGEWDDGDEYDSGGYWDEEHTWFMYEKQMKVIGIRIDKNDNQIELSVREC